MSDLPRRIGGLVSTTAPRLFSPLGSVDFYSADPELLTEVTRLTHKFEDAIQEKLVHGNVEVYDDIVDFLETPRTSSNAPTERELKIAFFAFSRIVSSLKPEAIELVAALLKFDWTIYEPVYDSYAFFLVNLISAQPTCSRAAARALIMRLKPPTEELSISFERQCSMVHASIQEMVSLVPTASSFVLEFISECFPDHSESFVIQLEYLKNILKVIDYLPMLRDKVFEIIVDRILRVDSDIRDLEDEYMNDEGNMKNDSLNQMDESNEIESIDSESCADYHFGKGFVSQDIGSKEIVESLESMLILIIRYCGNFFSNGNKSEVRKFFYSTLDVFHRLVMPTYRPKRVQFLWLYMCKFDTEYYDMFIGMLMCNMFNSSTPEIINVTSASYLGSFISRANYISTSTVRLCLKLLNEWCISYVNIRSDSDYENGLSRTRSNMIFYATFQTIIYIFCFWWKELLLGEHETGDNSDIADNVLVSLIDNIKNCTQAAASLSGTVKSLQSDIWSIRKFPRELDGFESLITSRYQPLKYCSKSVAREFAKITHKCNIFYCYPLIENEQEKLDKAQQDMRVDQKEGADSKISIKDELIIGSGKRFDLYFPFDNFGLAQSAEYITPIIREWEDSESLEDHDFNLDEKFQKSYGDEISSEPLCA